MSKPAAASLHSAPPKVDKPKESWGSFVWFCVKLVLIVLVFRSFVLTSFNIPSESMMPRLLVGDYLFAAKWPYGYSRYSLPLDAPLIPGRILADTPERGDVVIFKHPVDKSDYIKRVIGLPGDRVQLVSGIVHLDGEPVAHERVADFVLPLEPGEDCSHPQFRQMLAIGGAACVYPQFREMLPGGRSHRTLDLDVRQSDDTPPIIVPEGHLLLLGDNRDNSLDSRFTAEAGRGIGLVPMENLVGRASFVFFSTDGSAELLKPWTWFTAARWERIGRAI